MKKFLMFLCAISLVFGIVGTASAASILYFNDWSQGTDRMGEALATFSGTHDVNTVSSSSSFATEIRDMPRMPDHGSGCRCGDLQTALWTPLAEQALPAGRDRAVPDHQPEPRLRG